METVIIFPSLYGSMEIDPDFGHERDIASSLFATAVYDHDLFVSEGRLRTDAKAGHRALFRTYMMHGEEYGLLCGLLSARGISPMVSAEEYCSMHYIDGYWESVEGISVPALFHEDADALCRMVSDAGWGHAFVKDYAKSGGGDSVFSSKDLLYGLSLLRESRGGLFFKGYCAKEAVLGGFHDERRAFLFYGKPLGDVSDDIYCLGGSFSHIPLCSVDFGTAYGRRLVVECGDGQVSSLKENDASVFYSSLHSALLCR